MRAIRIAGTELVGGRGGGTEDETKRMAGDGVCGVKGGGGRTDW